MPTQQNILRLLRMLRPYSASCTKIRLGALADGGYVINDDLADLDGVISLGIGGDASFDLALAEQGIRVFQYDPTVEGPPVHHSRFLFRKAGWARYDAEGNRSLDTIIAENNLSDKNGLILKFDVEDSEWDAFQSVSAITLSRFRIIVGEFHFLNRISQADRFETMWHAFSTLLRNHVVTHLHANNCCGIDLIEGVVVPKVLEITFLRRDRASFVASQDPIPSELDYPNVVTKPELVLMPFQQSRCTADGGAGANTIEKMDRRIGIHSG